ncbi:hypothetical protein VKT23_018255 [Stygiomarasmius scandens]|uniref:Uncharacterized protein n=1 Tax=Marasmiellus scandens TaxID=2682957 RepID=A0ABR1IS89_9AGAR
MPTGRRKRADATDNGAAPVPDSNADIQHAETDSPAGHATIHGGTGRGGGPARRGRRGRATVGTGGRSRIESVQPETPAEELQPPAKKTRKPKDAPISPALQLPQRSNRGQPRANPDNGFVPRAPKRTSAQVREAEAAHAALVQRQRDELEASLRSLAEMEVDEEEEDREEERQRVVRRMASEDPSDENDTFFPVGDDDELDELEEDLATKTEKRAKPKFKRLAKGQAPARVADLKEEIRQDRDGKKKRKGKTRGNASDAGGILSDWQQRGAHEVVDLSNENDDNDNDTGISIHQGGLEEADIEDVKPQLSETPAKTRSNNLVTISKTILGKQAVTPKSKPINFKVSSTKFTKATSAPKTPTTVTKTHSQSSVGTDTSMVTFVPIPIVKNTWKTKGCDTFNALLFKSTRPFEEFVKGSEDFLDACQSVVPALYNSEYKVVKGDAIYEQGYDRIVDKRSDIGDKAQSVVDDFFLKHSNYATNPEGRREYARWALRKNGPLLFLQPGAADSDTPGKDSFLSPHIISIIKQCFPSCSRSVINVGIPVGLLGLAAAGLERAFRRYVNTGEKEPDGGFRAQFVGSAVDAYVKSASNLSENRCNRIREACGFNKVPEIPMDLVESDDELDIAGHRHLMYDASSPPASPTKS